MSAELTPLEALRTHCWVGRQQGGNPAEAESYEWIRYCAVCGMEDTCEDIVLPCPGSTSFVAQRRAYFVLGSILGFCVGAVVLLLWVIYAG